MAPLKSLLVVVSITKFSALSKVKPSGAAPVVALPVLTISMLGAQIWQEFDLTNLLQTSLEIRTWPGCASKPSVYPKAKTGSTKLEKAWVLTSRSGETQILTANGTRLDETSPREETETYPWIVPGAVVSILICWVAESMDQLTDDWSLLPFNGARPDLSWKTWTPPIPHSVPFGSI